jgi:MFS family permease
LPNLWLNCPGLPRGPAAALAALHLSEPHPERLACLEDRAARAALDYCDRSQLTLSVHRAAPAFLAEEMGPRAAKNLRRLKVVEATYRFIQDTLAAPQIPFVALKGITQCALSGIRPEDRAQYDVDVYLGRESVDTAYQRFLQHGYQGMEGMESFPTDHLPALVRSDAWQWRGDFFDPELPLAIELHFRFWSPDIERLPAPGAEAFWERRVARPVAGLDLPVLAPPDAIAYAALHLLKHILRGSTRPFHVYELARFLEGHADDDGFWNEWQQLHEPGLRRLQAVAFRFAEAWFGCALGSAAREEIERLPAAANTWFDLYAASPATQQFVPNKDELWLHLALLDSASDRLAVSRRRLFPVTLPPPVAAARSRGSLHGRREYAAHFLRRLRHHAIALFTTLASGVRWWARSNDFGGQFWTFLAAAVLFNFALFIFFMLYNLFLTDLGMDVEFVGRMNSAARLGSLAGIVPAAWIAHRMGLRKALILAIGLTALLTLLRAWAVAPAPVAALAFAASAVFSLWAVVMAPSIAAAVDEKRRPAAFSFFFSVMFATGIAGNWIAGQLPGWLGGKQAALYLAGALSALALAPALRLKPGKIDAPGTKIYPRGEFLLRFLAPFALWHLATGAFNPFNNVYLARLRFRVEQIGSIFSAAQLVQVVAVLLAPVVIRRAGLVSGIVYMMGATALALGGLSTEPAAVPAIVAYTAYMAFQWMSEPGLNTLLMNQVREHERGGASALNYLVAFSAQAVAAEAAGALIQGFGFGPVLAGSAVLAGLAAAMFQKLLGGKGGNRSAMTEER